MARSTTKSSSRNSGNRSNNSNNSKPRANSRLSQQAQHQRDPGGIRLETFWGLYRQKRTTDKPSITKPDFTRQSRRISDGKLMMGLGQTCRAGNLLFSWPSPHMRMGFLRSRSFQPLRLRCVSFPEHEQEAERFHHKKGTVASNFFGRTLECSCLLLSLFARNVLRSFEAPEKRVVKHRSTPWMISFEGTEKVEIVGDLDLYQLPSIICLIRQHLSSLQNWRSFNQTNPLGSLLQGTQTREVRYQLRC